MEAALQNPSFKSSTLAAPVRSTFNTVSNSKLYLIMLGSMVFGACDTIILKA